VPNLLVMHPSVKAANVAELIVLAKSTKEGLNWASSGNGSVQHMALELFKVSAGIPLNHIPYKGGAPALIDVAGGHIKFYFSNAAASTGPVKAGTIRALAHTGRGRLAAFPDQNAARHHHALERGPERHTARAGGYRPVGIA
jgi:tripartite-type tricarboxylate transporter receptor subunit TctC